MISVSFNMRPFDDNELLELRESGERVRSLDLTSCSLFYLPDAVLAIASSLEILNITWNQLSSLPEWLGDLERLTFLDCSFNRLDCLPSSIGNLSRLQELHLSDNNLQHLPDSCGHLTSLTALHLQYNKIVAIPTSLSLLSQLETFNLAGNPLEQTMPEGGVQQFLRSLSETAVNWRADLHGPKWRAEVNATRSNNGLTGDNIGHMRHLISGNGRETASVPPHEPELVHIRSTGFGNRMSYRQSEYPTEVTDEPAAMAPLRLSLPVGLREWRLRAGSRGAMNSRPVEDAVAVAQMLSRQSLRHSSTFPPIPIPHSVSANAIDGDLDGEEVLDNFAKRKGQRRKQAAPLYGRLDDKHRIKKDVNMSGTMWSQFLCPITQEVMREPVVAADGHTYEKAALQRWLALSPPPAAARSPMTGLPLAHTTLTPNYTLRSLILEHLRR